MLKLDGNICRRGPGRLSGGPSHFSLEPGPSRTGHVLVWIANPPQSGSLHPGVPHGVHLSWLSLFRRRPDLILAALKLGPGVRLADVGAGRGYFTFRFAKAIGASGVVFAVEPDRRKAVLLARQATQTFSTVHVVEPARDDPSLPGAVDIIFLSNVYHHLADQPA